MTDSPVVVARKRVGQDLEGDIAIGLCVARAIDLAHATDSDGGGDLVWAEASAGY